MKRQQAHRLGHAESFDTIALVLGIGQQQQVKADTMFGLPDGFHRSKFCRLVRGDLDCGKITEERHQNGDHYRPEDIIPKGMREQRLKAFLKCGGHVRG